MAKKKLKKNYRITQDQARKIKQSVTHKLKKEQGAMDGRFTTKVVSDKSNYTRKKKHKNDLDSE